MTLAYAERALGVGGADLVLELAGEKRPREQMMRDDEWSSVGEVMAVARAAARLCGDDDIGRRVGEHLFHVHVEEGAIEFIRAEGTPLAAMENTVAFATKTSSGRVFRVVDSSPTTVTVESVMNGLASGRDSFFCSVAAGYWAQLPSLFGSSGVITQQECLGKGHARCLIVLRWARELNELDAEDWERSRTRRDGSVRRFEELQAMASELALAHDVSTALECIVRSVGVSTMAPRFLLAVRLDETDALRVHQIGFADDEAGEAAEAVLSGGAAERFGVPLVVDVASPTRHYGRLAAFFPPHSEVSAVDERNLTAYAGHAMGALESAANLEAARRNRDRFEALLRLAESLATATDSGEVAHRLADAIPELTGANRARVWLWDETREGVRLAGSRLRAGDRPPQQDFVSAVDLPALRDFTTNPKPIAVTSDAGSAPLHSLLDDWGVARSFIAPVVVRGQLLGLLTAGYEHNGDGRLDRGEVLARLAGLAHHAAIAFDNSWLVERVKHQALHDPLTGLPNRAYVQEHAHQTLAAAGRAGRGAAVLFVDLDQFKNVNDTLGHSAGDELIQQVASRLQHCVRESDTVARLGGDEFLILLTDTRSPEDGVRVAKKVISAVHEPFTVSGQQLFISSSIGIASYPEHGDCYQTLMQHADAAMYEAKAHGRNAYALYAHELPAHRRDRLQLEVDLHVAVEREELAVLYQPQVDLRTGDMVGVEALVRWDHPTLGRLAPDAFLHVAEEAGLIADVDDWVRREALLQARSWHDEGVPLRVALNLSTRDLRNPELSSYFEQLLRESGVAPDLVELEVTDRVVMSSEDLPRILASLKSLGVRLAIDDFGTGNSVIARLHSCPVDVLKIDRSFIGELSSNDGEQRLVHALISLAHALRLEVVGEGIETAEQQRILTEYGCEYGQGHLFSRPVEASQITRIVRTRRRSHELVAASSAVRGAAKSTPTP